MLHKCACGTYTEYGLLCVKCSANLPEREQNFEEVPLEDLLEEEDQDSEEQ